MTLKEIVAAIEGYQKQKRTEWQYQALIAYQQANLTASFVAKVFGGTHKPPALHEAFPGLFPELERPRQQNWQIMKARIEAYAAERRKRGEMHGHDAGRAANSDHN